MVKLDKSVLARFASDKARKLAHVATECNGKVSRDFFSKESKEWGNVVFTATNGRTVRFASRGA